MGRPRRRPARGRTEGSRLFYNRDGKRTPIKRALQPRDSRRARAEGTDLAVRLPATTSTSSGPAARTGSSGSASSRFRGCGTRGCRGRTSSPTSPSCRTPRDAWLLKPLFSFAGGGIIFAPTDEQIAAIPADERRHYILQERIAFTPVIDTPHGATQVEIRMMMVRDGDGYRALIPLGCAWAAAR